MCDAHAWDPIGGGDDSARSNYGKWIAGKWFSKFTVRGHIHLSRRVREKVRNRDKNFVDLVGEVLRPLGKESSSDCDFGSEVQVLANLGKQQMGICAHINAVLDYRPYACLLVGC